MLPIRVMPPPTQTGTSVDPMQVGSERHALACVLNNVLKAVEKLDELEALLILPQHRDICRAYREVNESGETESNEVSVTCRLREIGRLEAAGGAKAVTNIGSESSGGSDLSIKSRLSARCRA